MDAATFSVLGQAFDAVVLDPKVLLTIVTCAAFGVFMGAIPGLTATMAIALLVPVTYFMGPVQAAAAVVALEACAIFAGDIPGALIRIPGTPSSAAYVDDMYAHTRAGRHERALGLSLLASVTGGLIGTVLLLLFAARLADVATLFTSVEYFWFYLLGLGCAVVIAQGAPLRALVALLIGLLLSTVGLSAVHGEARFTFGRPELYQGINFIPAMIGLFGFSEVLRNVIAGVALEASAAGAPRARSPFAAITSGHLARLLTRRWATLRSGLIGFLVGMLPGAGADIAAYVSYASSKRAARDPGEYGKGSLDGIADATLANNAALAGAWVPALSFGIPGDSITALLIGILMMKDVKLGPAIFETQGALVYGLYIAFFVTNLVLVPIGILAIRTGVLLIRIPRRILLPAILLFCVLGAYAIGGSSFDVGVMVALGLLGFLLERLAIPLAPVVLGIVLGGPLEESFIQTMTTAGRSWTVLVSRPLAAALAIATALLWLSPLHRRWRRLRA